MAEQLISSSWIVTVNYVQLPGDIKPRPASLAAVSPARPCRHPCTMLELLCHSLAVPVVSTASYACLDSLSAVV
jgi:hypothetical protein